MVTPGTGAALTDRALAAHAGPQSQYYGAPSTVAPGDSASVVAGAVPSALAVHHSAFDPSKVSWSVVNGEWHGKMGLMMAPRAALLAFGGRDKLQGEIDCVVDGGCTASGCVPDASNLVNLRAPEIPGMTVGNNQWCPAIATGDLVVYAVTVEGQCHRLVRERHVLPDIG